MVFECTQLILYRFLFSLTIDTSMEDNECTVRAQFIAIAIWPVPQKCVQNVEHPNCYYAALCNDCEPVSLSIYS